MATLCRLIVDPPQSGPWNMAVDEALLASAAECEIATFRIYEWNEPTLSLGYFQPYTDRQRHPPSLPCRVVRRTSGGGAILHHSEVTYSFSLPAHHQFARNSNELYLRVHRALVSTLGDLLDETSSERLRIGTNSPAILREPFLCFQRRAESDVTFAVGLTSDWKIAGSAQRRRRGGVLQHGSVLLATSAFAPELPGIEDLSGSLIPANAFVEAWCSQISSSLELIFQRDSLTDSERDLAKRIESERFASPAWTNRR